MRDSIFQVPIIGAFIDLEYLIAISEISSVVGYGAAHMHFSLCYQLIEKPVDVSCDTKAFKKEEETVTKENIEIYKDRFNEQIRLKIFEAWQNYRNNKTK